MGYTVGKGGAAAFKAKQEARRVESIKKYGTASVEYRLAKEKGQYASVELQKAVAVAGAAERKAAEEKRTKLITPSPTARYEAAKKAAAEAAEKQGIASAMATKLKGVQSRPRVVEVRGVVPDRESMTGRMGEVFAQQQIDKDIRTQRFQGTISGDLPGGKPQIEYDYDPKRETFIPEGGVKVEFEKDMLTPKMKEYEYLPESGLFVPEETIIEEPKISKLQFKVATMGEGLIPFYEGEAIKQKLDPYFQQQQKIREFELKHQKINMEASAIKFDFQFMSLPEIRSKYPNWEFKEGEEDMVSFSSKESPELDFSTTSYLKRIKEEKGLGKAVSLGLGLGAYRTGKEALVWAAPGGVVSKLASVPKIARTVVAAEKIAGGAMLGLLGYQAATDPMGTLEQAPEMIGGVLGYGAGRKLLRMKPRERIAEIKGVTIKGKQFAEVLVKREFEGKIETRKVLVEAWKIKELPMGEFTLAEIGFKAAEVPEGVSIDLLELAAKRKQPLKLGEPSEITRGRMDVLLEPTEVKLPYGIKGQPPVKTPGYIADVFGSIATGKGMKKFRGIELGYKIGAKEVKKGKPLRGDFEAWLSKTLGLPKDVAPEYKVKDMKIKIQDVLLGKDKLRMERRFDVELGKIERVPKLAIDKILGTKAITKQLVIKPYKPPKKIKIRKRKPTEKRPFWETFQEQLKATEGQRDIGERLRLKWEAREKLSEEMVKAEKQARKLMEVPKEKPVTTKKEYPIPTETLIGEVVKVTKPKVKVKPVIAEGIISGARTTQKQIQEQRQQVKTIADVFQFLTPREVAKPREDIITGVREKVGLKEKQKQIQKIMEIERTIQIPETKIEFKVPPPTTILLPSPKTKKDILLAKKRKLKEAKLRAQRRAYQASVGAVILDVGITEKQFKKIGEKQLIAGGIGMRPLVRRESIKQERKRLQRTQRLLVAPAKQSRKKTIKRFQTKTFSRRINNLLIGTPIPKPVPRRSKSIKKRKKNKGR